MFYYILSYTSGLYTEVLQTQKENYLYIYYL